jgi:hypothetical protein
MKGCCEGKKTKLDLKAPDMSNRDQALGFEHSKLHFC